MFQEKSRDCHSHTYLHLLITIINSLYLLIKTLNEIRIYGETDDRNGNYFLHSGCLFTMNRIYESDQVDNNIKNKIKKLDNDLLYALNLQTDMDIINEHTVALINEVYLAFIDIWIEELKRKGYYNKLLSLSEYDRKTYITFLLDKTYCKEYDFELKDRFKKLVEEYLLEKAA